MGSGGGPEGGPNGSRNRGNLDSVEIGKVQKPYIFVVKFGDFWRGPISGSAQVSKNNDKYVGFRDAFLGKT